VESGANPALYFSYFSTELQRAEIDGVFDDQPRALAIRLHTKKIGPALCWAEYSSPELRGHHATSRKDSRSEVLSRDDHEPEIAPLSEPPSPGANGSLATWQKGDTGG
jgi:hypothetical protein